MNFRTNVSWSESTSLATIVWAAPKSLILYICILEFDYNAFQQLGLQLIEFLTCHPIPGCGSSTTCIKHLTRGRLGAYKSCGLLLNF